MGAILSHPLDFADDLPDTLPLDDSASLFPLIEIFQLFNKCTSHYTSLPLS